MFQVSAHLLALSKTAGRFHLAVNVTISNFTPKPHTPFQWHSVSTAEFKRKQVRSRLPERICARCCHPGSMVGL